MGVCSLYHVCSVFCIDFSYIGRIQGDWAGLCGLLSPLESAFLDLSGSLRVTFPLPFNYHPVLTVMLKQETDSG